MNESELRELLAEALDELQAHLVIGRQEYEGHEWSRAVKPWCKRCHQYGKHTPDCLIERIRKAIADDAGAGNG